MSKISSVGEEEMERRESGWEGKRGEPDNASFHRSNWRESVGESKESSAYHGHKRILVNRCSQVTHLLLEVVRPYFPDSISHDGVLR